MSRWTGSWLSSGLSLPPVSDEPQDYQGQALGLPADGPGSIPSTARRVGAVTADWLMAIAVAGLVPMSRSTATLLVWAVIGVVAVALFAFTPGQLLLGLRVAPVLPAAGSAVTGAAVGVRGAVVRQLLLALAVPAFVTDRDGRGLHDRLSGTVVLRSR